MNNNIEKIESSKSIELMALAQKLKAKGEDIINLTCGEPDFNTPEAIKKTVITELAVNNTHYAVGKGLLELRTRIKEKLSKENRIIVNEEEILITPGAKFALYLVISTLLNPGDEVLILNPAWVSYIQMIIAVGGKPIQIALNEEDNYTFNKALLEKYYTSKTKAIIINSPNNPTGRVLTMPEIEALISFSQNKDIVIISDEIYEKICFNPNSFISIASIPVLKEKTITVNGFSKAYAMTGWRIAYLVGPQKIVDLIYKLYSHTITCVSPFIQKAAITALDCNLNIKEMNNIYLERRNTFIHNINQISGLEAKYPEGTFYSWVKFKKEDMNSEDFAMYLLKEAKVLGVPGKAYGNKYENYIRFSFATSMINLTKACDRIANCFKQ